MNWVLNNMLTTICDDINLERSIIPIIPVKYNTKLLNNGIYRNIKSNKKYREVVQSQSKLVSSDKVNNVIKLIFDNKLIKYITPLDRVFINCYYRKLLRAQLEEYFLDKKVISGLILTNYQNHENDGPIIATIKYLGIICRHLEIRSTITKSEFSYDKLYGYEFWYPLSKRFITVFGENRIVPIEEYEENPDKVVKLLNDIFFTWTGGKVNIKDNDSTKVVVTPGLFVTRLLPKLKNSNIVLK